MKDLASLQRAFQRHIYQPGQAMERAVHATPAANAARRLGIYAHAYGSRLVGALRVDYPALGALLGEAGFDRMVRGFIAAHPSRHSNLRWYGGDLAWYLSRSAHGRRRPMLRELARFEWALGLAFDAADASKVTAEEVARVAPAAWPGMRLKLHPSVQQLRLRSNAPDVWRAMIDERKSPAAVMRPMPLSWLIWRKGHEPFYRALPPEEARMLGAAARGSDFASLIGGLRRFVGAERAAQAGAQLLRDWLTEEMICAIEPGR